MNTIDTEKELNLDQITQAVRATIKESGGIGFKPVAYFDEPLDCVRVIVRDCSMTEVCINELLTLLEANHPESVDQPVEYVGFNIKGVQYLCHVYGLGADGVVKITEVLNRILAESPKPLVRLAVEAAFRLTTKLDIQTLTVKAA